MCNRDKYTIIKYMTYQHLLEVLIIFYVFIIIQIHTKILKCSYWATGYLLVEHLLK